MNDEEFKEALMKKALGYDVDEVVEEYASNEEGKSVLVKRKITKKHNPPDINALKFLLEQEEFEQDFSKMTDKQLEAEKMRLLQLLKEKENEKNEDGRM